VTRRVEEPLNPQFAQRGDEWAPFRLLVRELRPGHALIGEQPVQYGQGVARPPSSVAGDEFEAAVQP